MLSYLIFCILVLGAAFATHYFWKQRVERQLFEGAQIEFERLERTDPKLLEGLDKTSFSEIYTRTHLPRFPSYVLASATAFFAGLPFTLGLLSGTAYMAEKWGILPQPNDVATELYLNASGDASLVRKVSPETLSYIVQGYSGFYYFLGALAFWVLIVVFFMRRYHQRTPGTLREEIIRAR